MTSSADPSVGRPLFLVVGSGGLLGSALTRQLLSAGAEVRTPSVAWSDSASAARTVAASVAQVVGSGRPWRIAWCAGAGVVGTTQHELDAELRVLQASVSSARAAHAVDGPGGVFCLASSAGGVYAGSGRPPFSEATEPRPLAPYGRAKLTAERMVGELADEPRISVLIARLSNLYGPGQDLNKPQGLVSQLLRAQLTRQPISIYVPLDTARDYLYVEDAARMLGAGLEQAARAPGLHVKIVCSHRTASIGALLAEVSRVGRRRPPVILGTSPWSSFQVRDLSFRSTVWPGLDQLAVTTLPEGVARTLGALRGKLAEGRLAPRP